MKHTKQISIETTKNYTKIIKNYSVLEFDIATSKFQDLRKFRNKKLANLIRQSSFIYFLAFDVGGSRYLNKYQNTFGFVSNNILLMQNTFELIRKYKKKFIFASSQMSNMNHSNYGVLKSVGEKYTKILGGITVKFWNVYGIRSPQWRFRSGRVSRRSGPRGRSRGMGNGQRVVV